MHQRQPPPGTGGENLAGFIETEGEAIGRHPGTGQPLWIQWKHGLISSSQAVTVQGDPNELPWLLPALFDPQVNGFAGVDFQRDDLTREDLLKSVRALRQAGCTRFLLTLITAPWSRMMERLGRLQTWRAENAELAGAIIGWHLEGPFLSPEPGYCGAHPVAAMRDPTPGDILELRETAGRVPLVLTLAPERKGALEAIRLAVKLGIRVSLGHTNASTTQLAAALEAGATGITHLGNGCPQELDRHDNFLWRVLDQPDFMVSLIADGHHVSPPLFRLIHRAHPPAKVFHTTDAMAAAGAPAGRYTLGELEMAVGEDRIVRQPGRTNFAGSALTPVEGVFRSARMLRRSWRRTWASSSAIPAAWMGIRIGVIPGRRADFCLVQTDRKGELVELRTFWSGQESGHPPEDQIDREPVQAKPARRMKQVRVGPLRPPNDFV